MPKSPRQMKRKASKSSKVIYSLILRVKDKAVFSVRIHLKRSLLLPHFKWWITR